MRGTTRSAGPAGVCGRLSQEVGRFLRSQDWWSAGASKDRSAPRRRTLSVELLEVRRLMDAAGAASLLSPAWFQSIAGVTGPQHAGTPACAIQDTLASSAGKAASTTGQANLYDWIVQFNTAALCGVSSVAGTASLLAGGGINFQVIEGLGMVGEVLVRSSGASLGTRGKLALRRCSREHFRARLRSVNSTPPPTRPIRCKPEKTSNDPQLSSLWGLTKIDAADAWNVSTGSKNVVVAVVDTGVDYTDSDLAANIWTNPNAGADGFQGDVHGYDFVNNDGNPMDDNGHGTHVAGILGAVGNNAQGGVGVDWSVSIMPLKFLNSQGTGYLSDAIRAINYATMERTQYGVNVRVINASWGGSESSAALQSSIQAANDAGILFVTAAGNSGTNNDTTAQYPANYAAPNVISVAATDQNDKLASFSDYGPTTVDLAAPGVSIYSTVPGNKYATYSGTSMATPYVSGVAALCWAADPDATVAQVRTALLQGVDPLAGLSGKMVSGGRLDAYKTLELIEADVPQGPAIASLTASASSVTAGSAVTLTAHGLTAPSGTVTNVYFYQDTNNNGQYDAGDALVASTTAIAGGAASANLSTGGLAQGTYRYFARAVDNHGRWSTAAATTLTVLAADDYGNTPGHGRGDCRARLAARRDRRRRRRRLVPISSRGRQNLCFEHAARHAPELGIVPLRPQRHDPVGPRQRQQREPRLADHLDRPGGRNLLSCGRRQRKLVDRQLFAFRSDPKLGSRVGPDRRPDHVERPDDAHGSHQRHGPRRRSSELLRPSPGRRPVGAEGL